MGSSPALTALFKSFIRKVMTRKSRSCDFFFIFESFSQKLTTPQIYDFWLNREKESWEAHLHKQLRPNDFTSEVMALEDVKVSIF